jgi:NAD(P)-dependent dehydrogenase (short-subunit alcohol dehydrogenase family)
MQTAYRLDGTTAIVTGASSGLGDRFARVLAGAGARVAMLARRTDRLEKLAGEIAAAGGTALPVACDVTDLAQIARAVDQVERELGPIDVLVNNSGVTVTRRAMDSTADDFDRIIATNLRGGFFMSTEVAKRMAAAGRKGRIINVASSLALKPLPMVSIYAISKAAVVQMTKAFALEWARYDIAVNALCPGYIVTELNADYWETEGGRKLVEKLPKRRVGDPADLDGILLLLASEQASRLFNGAVIAVDDGLAVT